MNTKAASERYQRQVLELAKQSGNDTCADCGGRYPRWASWNLGIFLCVNCAGVHRKMGTHISKIKSLTLDTWTKEQVERMREGGNVKNNAKYNPDVRRNRPPANIDEGERNSDLERFIFDKYKGRFMDKKPPPVPSKDLPTLRPPHGSTTAGRRRVTEGLEGITGEEAIPRSRTAPIPSSWNEAKRAASVSPMPQHRALGQQGLGQGQASVADRAATMGTVSSNMLSPPTSLPMRSSSATLAPSVNHAAAPSGSAPTASSSVFDDLLSLSSSSNTMPQPALQMQQQPSPSTYAPHSAGNPWAALGTQQQAILSPMMMAGVSAPSYFQQDQPVTYLPSPQLQQQHAFFAQPSQERSASLGSMAFSPTGPYSPQPASSPFPNNSGVLMGQQAFGQYPQQQQQHQPPQFGAFANSMMPSTPQNAQQQYANAWQQQQQHANYHSNMWG